MVNDTESRILLICSKKPVGRKGILSEFGHKTLSGSVKRALFHLKKQELIEYTIAGKPSSRNQQYRITEKGREVLNLEGTR